MKAQILECVGKIECKDISKPIPKQGEALVKVKAAGICGSDIPRIYYNGAHHMPLVIGHEFAGEVCEIGCADNKYLLGKRVGIFPLIPCKKCIPCQNKQYEMCRYYNYLGSRCDGGFAEYVSVPIWNLIELSDNITFEQAAMLEPMAVAVHAMRQIEIKSERFFKGNICVFGLGTIGLLLVMFLLDAGILPENLYVIGNKNIQKEKVTSFGLPENNYCDSKIVQSEISTWLMDVTDGKGVDAYYECVGINESICLGIDSIAPAGHVCLVGNPASDIELPKDVYWKILRNQITLHGTWNSSYINETNIDDDWKYVIDCLKEGAVHPEMLITHRYKLEDLRDGFELMRDKKEPYIKVMGVMD